MEELNLIRKKKKKIKEDEDLILQEKEKEKKYELYKQILKIDNTDKRILLDYLLIVKQRQKINDISISPEEEIKSYINHFPPNEFNKYFNDIAIKEHSSIEKLLLIFEKILSQDWIETTFEKRREAYNFFIQTIKENFKPIKNTSPITWENKELYIFCLYKDLLLQLKKKLQYYEEQEKINENEIKSIKLIECDNHIIDLKKELSKPGHPKDFIEKTQKLLENTEKDRKVYQIIEGNFFGKYLKKFNSFLNVLKDTYIKELPLIKFEEKKDRDIFEYFMLIISNYDFENINAIKRDVWKSSFLNSMNDKNLKIIEQYKQKDSSMEFIFEKDNKLIIKSKNIPKIIIDNYDDYNLEYLVDDIFKNERFNEIKALEYVKIQKIDNHLYIKKIFDNWIIFNITIFNSKVIKSLYKTLFKNYDSFVLDENELTIIFNNVMFYSFEIDFVAMTNQETMKIYEYSNYKNLINIYDPHIKNEDVLKIIFLAFNLVANYHEILGNFNNGYQIYSFGEETKEDYESSKVNRDLFTDYTKNRNDKESGEEIEIKLFGRLIDELTLKEALFILNPTNYFLNDYVEFQKKFMKSNEEKMYIDETFWKILVDNFKINPENLLKAENKTYYLNHLIKKSFINTKKFVMKKRHPMNYNFDGFTKEDLEFIDNQIKLINDLNESI